MRPQVFFSKSKVFKVCLTPKSVQALKRECKNSQSIGKEWLSGSECPLYYWGGGVAFSERFFVKPKTEEGVEWALGLLSGALDSPQNRSQTLECLIREYSFLLGEIEAGEYVLSVMPRRILLREFPVQPVHGDVKINNMVKGSGGIRLIDWEYFSLQYFLFYDIADFCSHVERLYRKGQVGVGFFDKSRLLYQKSLDFYYLSEKEARALTLVTQILLGSNRTRLRGQKRKRYEKRLQDLQNLAPDIR